jgi:alcohol dehydrogenase class IV
MDSFEYISNPCRIVFGSGTLVKLPTELSRLGLSRPLLLSTPGRVTQLERLKGILDGNFSGIFTNATMHTPLPVTEKALEVAKLTNADSIVSIGGGSTTGLGKAISIRTGLPHICIPTTYAGSEVTPGLGETANGKKTTRSDPKILPTAVIYDVDLTRTLPVSITATSGVNAIAHAIEALYAFNSNPIINLIAQEGIRSLVSSLPILITDPFSQSARSTALYGAWLCGTCLGAVHMGIHHKLCHTLGGSFNLPHSETHTILLPHTLAYNAPKVPKTMEIIAKTLPDCDGDAIKGLNILLGKLKVERGLEAFGMKESEIDKATDIALNTPYQNPREIEYRHVRELLRRAWAGEDARADL